MRQKGQRWWKIFDRIWLLLHKTGGGEAIFFAFSKKLLKKSLLWVLGNRKGRKNNTEITQE
jgi:hypothetical protein